MNASNSNLRKEAYSKNRHLEDSYLSITSSYTGWMSQNGNMFNVYVKSNAIEIVEVYM